MKYPKGHEDHELVEDSFSATADQVYCRTCEKPLNGFLISDVFEGKYIEKR